MGVCDGGGGCLQERGWRLRGGGVFVKSSRRGE